MGTQKKLNRKKLNPSIAHYTGKERTGKLGIQLISFNAEGYKEDQHVKAANFKGFGNNSSISWLNTHGIHQVDDISSICETLNIHQLTIQDILDVDQRPKSQEYDNYWFFSLKSILPSSSKEVESEQISFILGKNYLVSFQEKKSVYFEHVRERIRNDLGIVRERGVDYLFYLLIESILDSYISTVDRIEEDLESKAFIDLEMDPSPEFIKSAAYYKRLIYQIKKTILPIREFANRIDREQFQFIEKRHIKYYMELKDLCIALIDDCEQIEMRIESQTNLFFSIQGHRMNQVMKVLTIVSTIFIPVTFVAGIYGMNFDNMPELHWKYSYFIVWFIIAGIFSLMLLFFKRKKWF